MRPQAMMAAPVALWVALAPGALAASPEIYSWVDADGVLHFTDAKDVARKVPYEGEDVEGFGGERPIVEVLKTGEKRTLYRVNVTRYDETLRAAAEHYNLPMAFLKAVAKVESNFNPRAVSNANAKGLMQIIDKTAAELSVEDPFDPAQSIFGGARYLRTLANMFEGDLELTAAAYNAGPERVMKARGIPQITETQRYVRRVIEMYDYYRRRE